MNPYQENRDQGISDINKTSKYRGFLLPILIIAAIAHIALFYVYMKHYNAGITQDNTLTIQNQENTPSVSPSELTVIDKEQDIEKQALSNTIEPVVLQGETSPEIQTDTATVDSTGDTNDINPTPLQSVSQSDTSATVSNDNGTAVSDTSTTPNNNVVDASTNVTQALPAIMDKTTKNVPTNTEYVNNNSAETKKSEQTNNNDTKNNKPNSNDATGTVQHRTVADNSQLITNNNTPKTAIKPTNEPAPKKATVAASHSQKMTNKSSENKKESSTKKQAHNKAMTNKKPRPIEPIKEYKGDTYSITPDIVPALTITQSQSPSKSQPNTQTNYQPNTQRTYQPTYKPTVKDTVKRVIPQKNTQQALKDAKLLDIDLPNAERKRLPINTQTPQNQQIKSDMKTLHKELAKNIETIKQFNKQKITKERQVSQQAYQDQLYIKQIKQKEALAGQIAETEAQLEESVSLITP